MNNEKIYKTISEQIDILKSRGLEIDDNEATAFALENLNYYRLSGYSLTLRKGDQFYPGTKFSDIMQIYNFDRELRLLLLDLLGDIEISLRTHIGYTIGKINPKGHLFTENYITENHFIEVSSDFSKAISDSKNEAFVKHHKTKYGGVMPVWVIVETLTFGMLSRMFSSLSTPLIKDISKKYYFGIPHKYLTNWFESIVVLRNLCAHKSRLYNRGLPSAILFDQDSFDLLCESGYDKNMIGKKVFFALIIMDRICPDEQKRNCFFEKFDKLMEKYPFVDIWHYGFQPEWKALLKRANAKYYASSASALLSGLSPFLYTSDVPRCTVMIQTSAEYLWRALSGSCPG